MVGNCEEREILIIEYLHTESHGHQRYVVSLANALAAYSDVAIVGPDRAITVEPAVEIHAIMPSIDLERSGLSRIVNRLRVYMSYPRVLKALLGTKPTGAIRVVQFQELPGVRASAMIRAAQAEGYIAAVTVHNVEPHSTHRIERLTHSLFLRAWKRADIVVVHSERLKSELSERGVQSSRIEVIPHPVWDVAQVRRVRPERDYLFFGLLRENKGVHLFIDALAALGDPPATIRGQGSAAMIADIREHLDRCGLSNCSFEPGFVPEEDIPELFADHRALVAPYTSFAAQSGVTHLALAHRIPVVVTDVGALGDLVRDYGVGAMSDRSCSSLSRAMLEVRSNIEAYSDAIEAAVDELSQERIAAKTAACFRNYASGRN